MNTLHFKYAVEVERTGSISQAADNLFMAQPNLSKAIKELEENLGITIFERTSKGVRATEPGTEFLGYARKILTQLDKMNSICLSKDEKAARQFLKLSIPRGSYISMGFSNFVNSLDLSREIDIHMQETNSLNAITNITENNFNLGVIRYQTTYENYFLDYLKDRNLDYETIWEFECLVLMSANHPLANAPHLDYKELLQHSIEIVHGDNTIPYLPSPEMRRPGIDCSNRKQQRRIYIYERGSQFDMLAHVPSAFMWVSPIPNELAQRNKLVQRKCKISGNRFKDLLIYPNGYKFSPVDKKFISKLYEEKIEVSFTDYE